MRKLMWFTIGFAAAAAVCTYGWFTDGLEFPAYCLFALFALFLAGSTVIRPARIPAVICLGAACGLIWFQIYSSSYLSRAEALDSQLADVTARCTDYSFETEMGTGVDGILYLDGISYRSRFYVNGDISMEPGDVLTGAFRFTTTTPEGELENTSWQGKGIFLIGYQAEECELKKLAEPPVWAYPAILRQTLLNLLDELFPQDTSSFAKALLLGDRSGLDYETRTALEVSGIMHVVAVSGLHVTILFMLIRNICLRKHWLVALVGLPVLGMFALVGGFSPSIIRACIMQGLVILAALFEREYDGATELSFACLVMLVVNPLVISSVSFQLSAGCMIGNYLFGKPISDWTSERVGKIENDVLSKWFRRISGSVSMTLGSVSLTTPLCAAYFGTVSLVGIVTNLLTLWVISFIFCGIIGVCLIGWFFPGAGAFLASLVAWPIRYVLFAAKMLARFPLSAAYTGSIHIVIWLAAGYVLFAVFLLLRKKRPAVFAGMIGLGLCIAVAVSWISPMMDNCRMTVLDVGQGQSIILQSDGKTYLVDCGGSYDEDAADLAAHTLLSQGIFRLDGLILTHFDRDHSGGAAYLLSRISTDVIFVPDVSDENNVRTMLEEKAPGRVIAVSEDLRISFGSTEIDVFAPVIPDSGNESSLAVLFRKENCDILITGDRSSFGERMLLKTAQLPDLEVLVAGHHGSKHSTCEELLAATAPDIVVISVGENSYGHPAQEVLDRITKYGCTVYRTDIDGNIVIRR